MISSSGSNNPSGFGGTQTPQPAAQAFRPAQGQTFTPAQAQQPPSFAGTQASQAVVTNRSQQVFTPTQAQAQAPAAPSLPQGQNMTFKDLKSQVDTAAKALRTFTDTVTQAMKKVGDESTGTSQADPQFQPAQAPESPVSPMTPPSNWKQDRQGRWRDERGRFVPSEKLREAGVPTPEGDTQAPSMMPFRSPRFAAARRVASFATSAAGSTSINQALQGLPLGGLIAGSLSKLEEMGMRGAEFELSALQAGMTRGLGQGTGYATQNTSYHSISTLSSTLGISPSAAAGILRDVGTGTQGELSVADIAGLTVRGFDPASVSALGGQLRAAGVGGAGTVLQTMGIARRQGLSNAGVMSFAQAVGGFATGRRQAGLDITDASLTARRARSMILRDEDRPSLEANLATLGRFQSVGVTASKGLSGFAAGMSDQMLQAFAFEQAGGDIFKATALLEDLSADPVKMREAMRAQGASDVQVDIALLATGQLTTTDIRRGRQAMRGEQAPRMRTGIASTQASLAASRAVAEKGQRDLEQLYGTTGGEGESVVSRFNTLMREQTKYQTAVLKKMPSSAQISAITEKLIGLLEATDFIKALAIESYGARITPAARPERETSIGRARHMTNLKAGMMY